MTHTETTITQAYTSTGLQLVESTSLVSDLVTDLQQKMILFVVGPYREAFAVFKNVFKRVHVREQEAPGQGQG